MVDAGTLEDVLSELHNNFPAASCRAAIRIEDGQLPASIPLTEGQWYFLEGSRLNDGLHLHPADDLTDEEEFEGTVTVAAIPRPLLRLAEEIQAWREAYRQGAAKAAASPYQSESFGGYSYSKGDAEGSGWRKSFAADLNRWRKMY